MPIEELPGHGGRPGVERVSITNAEWDDYYCGVHIHELRYRTTVPYVLTVADTWVYVTLPIDFMFKLVKYEFLHTNGSNVLVNNNTQWTLNRTRESLGTSVIIVVAGGDTGPTSSCLVEFNERYIYPPTNIILGWIYGDSNDRIWPNVTIQVTY